jgi:hypothetical protein
MIATQQHPQLFDIIRCPAGILIGSPSTYFFFNFFWAPGEERGEASSKNE